MCLSWSIIKYLEDFSYLVAAALFDTKMKCDDVHSSNSPRGEITLFASFKVFNITSRYDMHTEPNAKFMAKLASNSCLK